MPKERVLIIDDDAAWSEAISTFLESKGLEIFSAETCRAAEEAWRQTRPDVAVLDYSLPDGTAITLLPKLKAIDASIPVIILTGCGSIDLAVEAMKLGAMQFLTKPAELGSVFVVVKEALEIRRTRQKQLVERALGARRGQDPFLGVSSVIRQLGDLVRKISQFESPILIQGETGTGKGVMARWIHQHGPRASEAFVDLNCGGLSSELLETELFGHEKGAFTGAVQTKAGLLEVAHKGTVFLDEIGDVDLQVQPKLLKVLEEKQFRHLGDTKDRRVDIRLLAATHRDVGELIRTGKFRSDLYFRISAVPIILPSLRERMEDIPVLAEHLLRELCNDLAVGNVSFTPGAMMALQSYSWPGNIRELRNVIERALLLRDSDQLSEKDLHFDLRMEAEHLAAPPITKTLAELEREHITETLSRSGGNVNAAATALGIPRSSLYHKIKEYGLTKESSFTSKA